MRVTYESARIINSGHLGRVVLVNCKSCRRNIGRILGETASGGEVTVMIFHRSEALVTGFFTLSCVNCRRPLLKFAPDVETTTEITTTTKIGGRND